jgi:7-carboxy-7-deazaguanine synthase
MSESVLSRLPLMESFYTIQGEGVYTGHAAFFLRLGGCDVGCVWCDVKDSWDAEKHPLAVISDMIKPAIDAAAPIVVVTGGEPAMHDLTELTSEIRQQGMRAHIETSGAHPLTGKWDWVCLSPKKFKMPLPEVYQKADELKVIIYNKNDFEWAEAEASRVSKNCRLLLQPEWSRATEMSALIVDYVRQNPRWQISLQTHKYLNIP